MAEENKEQFMKRYKACKTSCLISSISQFLLLIQFVFILGLSMLSEIRILFAPLSLLLFLLGVALTPLVMAHLVVHEGMRTYVRYKQWNK